MKKKDSPDGPGGAPPEEFAFAPIQRPIPTPREIYDHLDQYVVGQQTAKQTVAIAAYNHQKRLASKGRLPKGLIKKSNILLVGSTGSGKTWIARKLSEALEVPFVVVDATEYTEAGYYGKDVEVIVAELLHRANMDVEATQRGIVFIDEIDKLAKAGQGARTGSQGRDIGGEGVQQSLLKILEGREIYVPYNVTQHWNKHDFVKIDTTDILFMCAGTFAGMELYDESSIGFGKADGESDGRKKRPVEIADLQEYGMIPELLGRLPVIVELSALSGDELKAIVTDPPDSIFREYSELLALDDIRLTMDDAALEALVDWVQRRKLGARGFRGIFEELLRTIMFEAPERKGESYALKAEAIRALMKRDDRIPT